MQEKSVETAGAGWVLVAVMMVLFWPVGLILLIKKLQKDRSATFKGSRTITVLGWTLIVLAAVGALAALTSSDGAGITMIVLFLAGGLILLQKGGQMQKIGKKYRSYISIVVNEGETRISEIAAAAGVDEKTTEKDLQEMLDKGYFNGHINHKNKELVLANTHNLENVQFEVVRCDNCGADNKIMVGRPRKCAYCRSLIRT